MAGKGSAVRVPIKARLSPGARTSDPKVMRSVMLLASKRLQGTERGRFARFFNPGKGDLSLRGTGTRAVKRGQVTEVVVRNGPKRTPIKPQSKRPQRKPTPRSN